MCRFLTTGILGITVLYLGLLLPLHYVSTIPECLDEPCSSEGVDNSIIAWATDFFVTAATLSFAGHLISTMRRNNSNIRKSGIFAQIFMSGSFAMSGIVHLIYPNSGSQDAKGMIGYWMLWMTSIIFFTASAVSHTEFATGASQGLTALQKPCCADRVVNIYRSLLITCCIGICIGSLWCTFTPEEEDPQTEILLDDIEDSSAWRQQPTCIQIITICQPVFYLLYALLWVPTGLMLKDAAFHLTNRASILGLSSPTAAGTIIVLQCSVGAMYIVFITFVSWIRGTTFLELYHSVYGNEVYHYGMLLSFYCLHNLSTVLTISKGAVAPNTRTTPAEPENKSWFADMIEQMEKGILSRSKK